VPLAKRAYRLTGAIIAGGLLLGNGCLAGLERSLDMILAPGATGNIVSLPYSPVLGLAQLLARFCLG